MDLTRSTQHALGKDIAQAVNTLSRDRRFNAFSPTEWPRDDPARFQRCCDDTRVPHPDGGDRVRRGKRSVRLLLREGGSLGYDYLVLATGVEYDYFGHDTWTAFAPSLKTPSGRG